MNEENAAAMKQKPIPIIFTHAGNSWYLQYTLRQAAASNPCNRTILLGDASNKGFRSIVEWHESALFSHGYEEFLSIYRHMSSNPPKNEILCFLRWFTARNFMRKHNLTEAFFCDTDVMLYIDLSTLAQAWGGALAVGIRPDESRYKWSVSPQLTYMSLDCLEAFCAFLLASYAGDTLKKYQEKWNFHVAGNIPGGICDMTALYLFVNTLADGEVKSIYGDVAEGICDHNISEHSVRPDQKFSMENGIKRIKLREGRPYCLEAASGKEYLFHILHFQGQAKQYIPLYYTGRSFPLHGLLRIPVLQRCYGKFFRYVKAV